MLNLGIKEDLKEDFYTKTLEARVYLIKVWRDGDGGNYFRPNVIQRFHKLV